MDDRIEQLERLAALHRDGSLSDDEFRAEKLRVLAGDRGDRPVEPLAPSAPEARPAPAPEPIVVPPPTIEAPVVAPPVVAPPVVAGPMVPPPPPVSPAADRRPEVATIPIPPASAEGGLDPEFGDRFTEPSDARRTGRGRWIALALAALVVALAGAVWFMRSTPSDPPARSTIGSAGPRAPSPDDRALGMDGGSADDRTDDVAGNSMDPVEEPEEVVGTGASDVSAALAIADPAECRFGADGSRAFDALLSRSGDGWNTDGPVRLGDVTLTPKLEVSQINPKRAADQEPADDTAAAPQRAPSTRYFATARAPDGVSWNGLRFSRLVRSHLARPDGGTTDRRGLTFRDEPAAVRARLNSLGVDVPAGGRPIGGSCRGEMRLEAIPGGSALVCERRCG